ncbi:phenylalanine--tRNA ligase subunit beta [Thermotoga sp. KOL6]|uniref:phenylalanine--tRNA ligase subunit beta n=1 Tax=Thermotoga sp. KOL6 TaxID=126741 RepID=UPI000C75758B|nr:phenylalanine--tRNA ligase subunit beta [Thermotoga sp. KOL6]PLV58308.1 phenylalanine--tRNA ligase subunit beta [Thermotoga sp. KOL6]
MKVPESWLREFIDLDWDTEKIAEKLTFSGTSVEDIVEPFNLSGEILTAKVLEAKVHPETEKLLICKVSTGSRDYTVITADKTVKEGDYVILALEGATLNDGVRIQPREFKGIVSEGMLCSLEELGLEEKSENVYRFPEPVELGMNVIEKFGLRDHVFDLEITPNRPDCLSVLGVARELSALSGRPLKKPSPKVSFVDDEIDFEVFINDVDGCPRYSARIMKGVEVKDSPLWMKARLVASGMRSLNNIIDATNYIMLELGHPVHAFDLNRLKNKKIVVKSAEGGERVLLLDEKEYELKGGEILITDGENILALGGIMGGMNSGVYNDTKNLVLEVAYFNPVRIRKTSKTLGIVTESSYRFERGVDPNDVEFVSLRLAELIQKLSGGVVLNKFWDVYPRRIEKKRVFLRKEKIKSVLGMRVQGANEILERLEFEVKDEGERYEVTVPTFRPDVEREIDLIEEIGRVFGYEKIPSQVVSVPALNIGWNERQLFRKEISQFMKAMGFDEIISFSFVDSEQMQKWPIVAKEPVRLSNPISSEMDVMRTSLFYSLIQVLSGNFKRQNRNLKLFEIGKVYFKEKEEYRETEMLSAMTCGMENPYDYTDKRKVSFYTIKGVLDELFQKLGISVDFKEAILPGLFPTRTAKILFEIEELGIVGMVDPKLLDEYDVNEEVYFFEINLDLLWRISKGKPFYKPTPKFPSIRRDVSFLLPKGFKSIEVVNLFRKMGGTLVEEVGVFDVYEGKGVPTGMISVTFYVVFRHPERTLTDEEVNQMFEKMVEEAEKKLGIKRRF